MSLILEALKKLDREKQGPDRGLLVVGPAAWPSNRGGRATAAASALVGGVLAVAAMAGVLWLFGSPKQPADATRPPLAAVPAPAPATVAPRPAIPAKPATGIAPARSGATAARAPSDPATPAAPSKPPKPATADFQLQAISAQDGQPVAVLNDHLVREGDTFEGVRVVRIGADEVEIEVAGRRRIVKF